MDDHTLARYLATAAGELLLGLRRDHRESSGAELGEEGDRQANTLLLKALAEHRPEDAVRSEESDDVTSASGSGRLWIIDPLDGTREYRDRARNDWAVHVGLAENGTLVAGAVAVPAIGRTFATDRPEPLAAAASHSRPRVAVSRSHRPAVVDALAEKMAVELIPMGSAGVKAIAVLTGAVDAYIHAGGQYEWDSAAPVAVLAAAGAHASRIDGSPLIYGNPTPDLPDLLICRPELKEEMLAGLAAVATSEIGGADAG
ncbi:3'(2'),5'-bisphosphate nucleotidase CysQ [Amycolatopsis sp. lyj-112]|uniref:3'(2'),5'-bisphosphate nucleotidase CysQ n=1 Tax=Amycolatopsis sp. lyj-112 TaxID=2789288 RepID=UPI00397C7E07